MKGIIRSGLVTGLLAMCLMSNVYATDGNKILKKEILKSEESEFLNKLLINYLLLVMILDIFLLFH